LQSIEECDAAMYRLLIATLEREKLECARDAQVAAAQKIFALDIDKAVKAQAEEEARLQQFYLTHLEICEAGGRKSLRLNYGVMGRRASPEALRLANKSWTWAAVLTKLQSMFPGQFVRLAEPEIDKDKVKADFERGMLADFGMKIERGETFYAELRALDSPASLRELLGQLRLEE
jgi:hypothetical protein